MNTCEHDCEQNLFSTGDIILSSLSGVEIRYIFGVHA